MATYLGYVAGGKCRDTTQATRPKVHREFWVRDELQRKGITAWVGRRIEFKRVGKRRRPDRFDTPVLPNYIFITMEPDQFYDALQVKHLVPVLQMVPHTELSELERFKQAVRDAEIAAERVDANLWASVAEYTKGQALQALNSFADFPLTFLRMVEASQKGWPMVEAEVSMMGRKVPVRFDPLDVKAAE